MKRYLSVPIFLTVFFLSVSASMAAEEGFIQKIRKKMAGTTGKETVAKDQVKKGSQSPSPVVNKAKPGPEKPQKELTREEILDRLKFELSAEDEVFSMIPDLKAEKGAKGEAVYRYRGDKIEELSDEKLKNIFTKVNQAVIKIRTERVNQQLAVIQNAQNLQNQQRAMAIANQSRVIVTPPPVPAPPPQAPRAPQIPRPPQPPPAPPRTR